MGVCGIGMESNFPWGGGDTMQCADDALLTCTLETYMVLQTSITPINSNRQTNKQFLPKYLESISSILE